MFSHEVCIHIQYFFGVVRNKLQTLTKYLLELIKRRSKVQEKKCHINVLWILTNKNIFRKL